MKEKQAQEIQEILVKYAENNQYKEAIKYVHDNEESIKKLCDTFGNEVNPYLRSAYDTACSKGHDKFALEYQKDLQTLLGDNILFLDE